MNIGHAILEIRKEKGLKQEAIALDAGTNTGHLSRIEQGTRQPSLRMLERLALALGVTLTELVSRAEGLPLALESVSPDDSPGLQPLAKKLTPANRRLAVELIRTLLRVQGNELGLLLTLVSAEIQPNNLPQCPTVASTSVACQILK